MSVDFVLAGQCGRIPFDEVVVGDTETTGLAPYGTRDGRPATDPHGPDRMCSASFVRVRRAGEGWLREATLSILCDPGRPVPEAAARVNGFHWSGDGSRVPSGRTDLAGASSFNTVARLVVDFIGGRPLVFHNAVFDAAVLDAELERAELPLLDVPILCTKKAFSDIQGNGRPDRYVPGTNLNLLCDTLGVDRSTRMLADGTEMHGAAVDAEMAVECFADLEALGWMEAEEPSLLPHRREDGTEDRIRRAVALAMDAWGGRGGAERYLWRPHPLLGMRRPFEVAASGMEGLHDVEAALAGLRYSLAV